MTTRSDNDVGSAVSAHSPDVEPLKPKAVLVVEDEDNVRMLMSEVLSNQGYVVLTAPDGAEALRASDRHAGTLDLVIVDVVLPGMTSQQLIERLIAARPGLKALYISGHFDELVLAHGGRITPDALLQKPFTIATLTRRVRDVLGQPRR
jgi:DNA-binding response OmpR family regulator